MLRSLYMKQYVFFVQTQSHVLAALFSERYVRYFGSLHPAFEMSCDTEYLEKKQLLIFSETWSSSLCIVCNCFDDFRTNPPKSFGRFHWKKNTNFPKWRLVRSKKVCLRSALLFSSVVTQNMFWELTFGLCIWNNRCFLFNCRVTFGLRQFSKVRFVTLALYILPLRCLVISNTYKNSFSFLSKRETFQNDVEYVPKLSFWALLGYFFGCN